MPFLVAVTDLDIDDVHVRCLVLTDLTVQKAMEKQLAKRAADMERQHLVREVNDTIVQGLVTAEMALDLEEYDYARGVIAHTSEQARAGSASSPRAASCFPAWPCADGRPDQEGPPWTVRRPEHEGADRRRLADLRMLISRVIERRADGWEVVAQAVDGREAIVAATAHDVDLVLLDIAMPVMDGMEALPRIREAAPKAVVVMLSGFPFAVAGQGALDAGAHGYLEKTDLVKGLVPRAAEDHRHCPRPRLPAARRP